MKLVIYEKNGSLNFAIFYRNHLVAYGLSCCMKFLDGIDISAWEKGTYRVDYKITNITKGGKEWKS